MLEQQRDVFYYVTAMNENDAQPSLPADAHEGVLRGLYRFRRSVREARAARAAARRRRDPRRGDRRPPSGSRPSTAWPPTSGARPASASWRATASPAEAAWRHGAADARRSAWLTAQLAPTEGPIVIATDYVRAVPEQIRAFLPPGRRCVTLGTDGFGRSDTRAALRRALRGRRRGDRGGGAAAARLRGGRWAIAARGPGATTPSRCTRPRASRGPARRDAERTPRARSRRSRWHAPGLGAPHTTA